MKVEVFVDKTKKITLDQSNYKAKGGEGTVFVKGDLAYKIYHEPCKMIPEMKIKELQQVQLDNVLAPINVLYDYQGIPIGFSMKYVKECDYLCKLFTLGFLKDNNITHDTIINIVKKLQETLAIIHKRQILVVDYNELNFLIDKQYTPYHIDVDSYQTKNFPATAIMDSIRDRHNKTFSELTDWFSWAIITFQLYMGIHPYKGNHPKYTAKDFDVRMKNNVSVFNPDSKLPPMFSDFNKIPPKHKEWYQRVFEKGERSIPPLLDKVTHTITKKITTVKSDQAFEVNKLFSVESEILNVFITHGDIYITTRNKLYKNGKEILSYPNNRSNKILLGESSSGDIILGIYDKNILHFYDQKYNLLGDIKTNNCMSYNNCFYTLNDSGDVIENSFIKLGKIKHITNQISSVPILSSNLYEGVIIQDIFGNIRLSIPYEKSMCANINIPELTGYRILDAKYDKLFCFVIGEKNRRFDLIKLHFNKDHTSYDHLIEKNVDFKSVNFCIKQNKIGILVKSHQTLELFLNLTSNSKEFINSPININMPVFDGIDKNLFVDDDTLYMIKNK